MSSDSFCNALKSVHAVWPMDGWLLGFIEATVERHNVHLAPWTVALLLNFVTAVNAFSKALNAGKLDECAKLSKWLVDASLSVQESFIKAGTPAPSGPAELYQELLKRGYVPPAAELVRNDSAPTADVEGNG
jgi:hypothetical protein